MYTTIVLHTPTKSGELAISILPIYQFIKENCSGPKIFGSQPLTGQSLLLCGVNITNLTILKLVPQIRKCLFFPATPAFSFIHDFLIHLITSNARSLISTINLQARTHTVTAQLLLCPWSEAQKRIRNGEIPTMRTIH